MGSVEEVAALFCSGPEQGSFSLPSFAPHTHTHCNFYTLIQYSNLYYCTAPGRHWCTIGACVGTMAKTHIRTLKFLFLPLQYFLLSVIITQELKYTTGANSHSHNVYCFLVCLCHATGACKPNGMLSSLPRWVAKHYP